MEKLSLSFRLQRAARTNRKKFDSDARAREREQRQIDREATRAVGNRESVGKTVHADTVLRANDSGWHPGDSARRDPRDDWEHPRVVSRNFPRREVLE
jgi:hypothetical protein